MTPRTALITGVSRGFGRALAESLLAAGWTVVGDARSSMPPGTVAVPGDVTDPLHRAELSAAAGRVDLLVNNASTLGPSPLPALRSLPAHAFLEILRTNVVAPLALIQATELAPGAVVVNVSSDAAVEAYEGWGGYGASKAALDQVSAVLAAERPDLRVYSFDPGDMRTQMHQDAYPGEDISDRPLPSDVAVPALLRLIADRPASGRYRASDLLVAT